MSSLEKLVRKSEKANEVFVAGRVFLKLAIIFLLISVGIMIATLIELRNIELTSTKGIIFVTLCAISILEFLIFLVIAVIIYYYGIFLEAMQRKKSTIMQKKSIKSILGDDMFMAHIVGFIFITIYTCMMVGLDSWLNLGDLFMAILFAVLLILVTPVSIFLGERLADHFSSI